MAEKVKNNENNYKPQDYRANRIYDGGRLLVPNRMPEKNSFEKVLEDHQQGQDFNAVHHPDQQTTNTATREAVRNVMSQKERFGQGKDKSEEKSKERESEREESAGEASQGPATARVKEADRRVIAKQGLSERGSRGQKDGKQGEPGGGGGQPSGRQGQFPGGSASGVRNLKGTGVVLRTDPKQMQFEAILQKGMAGATNEVAGTSKPREAKPGNLITKEMLDQIVQYCRLVTRTDGDKEMEMQLHDAVFKGLKIRVAMKNGKVDATFVTESGDLRGLFEAHKSDIRSTLAEKGIDVGAINVIMV